jgi:predicted nucleotidyltransferase
VSRADLAILVRAGSHAYGTARPDSDDDYRGVYLAPTVDLYRLRRPAESFDRRDPDVTLYELGKFATLAAAANPTVLEILWAEPLHISPAGVILRLHRDVFLSRRALKTYGGYARQQLSKATKGIGGSRGSGHSRREKFLLHTIRLAEAGLHLLRTGEVQVRVPDPVGLWERANRGLDAVVAEFADLDDRLAAASASSPLPEHPDLEAIDRLLILLRRDIGARP